MHSHRRLHVLFLTFALAAPAAALAAKQTISGQVIDANGKGVAQAIVFVQDSSVQERADSPAPTAIMDQIDKTFIPGVLPVVVGTQVHFPNRDRIHHHVYSFSRAKRFELPLYKGEEASPVVFDKAGVVTIGCNIHDWMSAIILVLPSPHYAVTNEDGGFTLPDLEPGTYTLTAWHAQSREKTQDIAQRVEVTGSNLDVVFKVTLAPVRSRAAMRGSRWDP